MVPLGFNVATYMGNLLIFFMLFHALNVKRFIRKCFGLATFSYSSKFNDLMVAAGSELVQQERRVLLSESSEQKVKQEVPFVDLF